MDSELMTSRTRSLLAASFVAALFSVAAAAQGGAQTRPSGPAADYIVGAQDVLTITCYDQADLSGKFTVETDGTFSYPLIGRVKVGGLTLRQVESEVKTRLVGDGYFRKPQITVSVDTYKSQKVFVVGEVRTPGTYALSGDMNLVEALAGGVTDRGTTSRIRIVRIVNGEKREVKVKLTDLVLSGDTVMVAERFF